MVSSKQVVNATSGEVLAWDAAVAKTARERRRGLIGHDILKPGEALILPRCRQVHSFGMRFSIDVVFIDSKGQVAMTCPGFEPRRISPIAWRARSAIELPAGTIEKTRTLSGDQILTGDKVK